MATAQDAQTLLDNSSCDRCYLAGMEWYGILAALIDIGNGLPVPTAQTLATEASCLSCVITPGNLGFAILAALRDSGVSGGGGGLVGSGSPEGVVTATPGTTYYDPATGAFWVKGTGTGSTGWTQLIA